MRKINKIILHCSASDNPKHDDIRVIDQWHEAREWESPSGVHCGYHYFINKSGIIQEGRPLSEVGSHVKGENQDSIGICLSGNYQFYKGQVLALRRLIGDLRLEFGDLPLEPHKKYNPGETCPNISMTYVRSMIPPYVASRKDLAPLEDKKTEAKKKPRAAAPKKIKGKAIEAEKAKADKLAK